jgi:hypothetical protein
MHLKYIFYNHFKYWIAELSNEGLNPWDSAFFAQQMQERNDWCDAIECNEGDWHKPLFKLLDLGENAELDAGKVKRGAYTYTIYKLCVGWQLLDAGLSLAELSLKNGDCLLIDSSFKPSRGVIVTPTPLRLPKSFESYVNAYEYSSFQTPLVHVCYAAEFDSIGLYFRNNPDLLERIEREGFRVSLDETISSEKLNQHPYHLKDDYYQQLLFDALGWYNYSPQNSSQYKEQQPQLNWIFNEGYFGFIKVVYSEYRNYDPKKYLYIVLDSDYTTTLHSLIACITNFEAYRKQHFEEIREIILDCIPHMKLEKTSSYFVMLEQIMRQKKLGLMSEKEAHQLSYQEAHQQMAKINQTDLFYEQCIKEFGEKARILIA